MTPDERALFSETEIASFGFERPLSNGPEETPLAITTAVNPSLYDSGLDDDDPEIGGDDGMFMMD